MRVKDVRDAIEGLPDDQWLTHAHDEHGLTGHSIPHTHEDTP